MILTHKDKGLLREAIEHWRRHENGTAKPDEGVHADSCALCSKYLNDETGRCTGCPIHWHTQKHLCVGTPWREAAHAFYDLDARRRYGRVDDKGVSSAVEAELKFKRAAKKMRRFLERILLEGKD